ncbi:PKD-like family protein [Sphingobacterium nematocida]|uniref:PKD-like family protein n=1 Tax=Sphingobacterium nematocida TaxID=1513896 RepID=A0A1T5DF10_9SPHI|nr:PKD-like family lipoprotein [Sphingobacterium nematocida]SKB70294.1 PKD-like family protein [Sphingobacterium nematocida]
MKEKLYTIHFFVIVFLLGSCSKDLGNYSYHDINEVNIAGLEQSYTAVFKSDTIRISPTLVFSEDTDTPDRYTYEWKLVKSTPTTDLDWKGTIISTERDLDYLVSAVPGSYSIYYKVKDKETSVTWTTRTVLNVTTQTATGFLLIGEDEAGYAEAEMISYVVGDTVIIRELLHDNGVPRFKGATSIFHTGNGNSSVNAQAKVWISGTDAGYYVDKNSFQTNALSVFKNMMYTSYSLADKIFPVDYAPKTATYSGTIVGSQRVMLTNTGDLFTAGIISGDIYSNPINRLTTVSGAPLLKLAPYILHGGSSALSGYIVFDKDNNRFLRTTAASSANLTVLADGPNDAFPWIQPAGRTMLYAENTKNTDGGSSSGNSFALMKDQNSLFYIYKFYAYGTPSKRNGYTVNRQFSDELNKSKLFAFASTRTAMYFAIGSKLYAYDYNTGSERIVMIKDYGDEITMLHSDIQASTTSLDLYVATYNSTSKGRLHKMILQNNTNTIEMKEDETVVWTGLSKIKNMSWRNAS